MTAVKLLPIDEGLYALRLGELPGGSAEIGGMAVPAAHVSAPFAGDGNGVEIVASFPEQGPWIRKPGGTLVVRAARAGGYVLITAYGAAPAQHDIAYDLRRLDGPAAANLQTAIPTGAGPSDEVREVPTEILLHIERAGDRLFPGRGWVGALGRRMRIEAYSIRPTAQLAPGDIEMKAFLPNGGETPWIPGGILCGTRGRGLPLIGFAVRMTAQKSDQFEVSYQGSFFASGISETQRNGAPCRARIADDPLEAVNVRITERIADVDPDEIEAADSETARPAS
ncbi:MAG: hypothetical protein JO001_29830 [Alphaproteobacteria bacterium]|nr:hypothetical protein [Alphaproteobacteria bacterium]